MKNVIFKLFVLALMIFGVSLITCAQENNAKIKRAPEKVEIKKINTPKLQMAVKNEEKKDTKPEKRPIRRELPAENVKMKAYPAEVK